MLQRPRWLRLRGRWVCFGVGTICATSLALSGCSRTPMARFKEATTATDSGGASHSSTASGEKPDLRDSVAGGRSPSTGHVSNVGSHERRNLFQRYRDGNADQRNRETADSRDPFLEAEGSASTREFPTTDALAPRYQPVTPSPGPSDSVARADLRSQHQGAVENASLQRPGAGDVAARTATPQPPVSRLDQLREELRAQRAAEANAKPFPEHPFVADSDRGRVLTTGPEVEHQSRGNVFSTAAARGPAGLISDRAAGVGRTEAREQIGQPVPQEGIARVERGSADIARVAIVPGEKASPAQTTARRQGNDETALRVQALLASAEWQAERGELEEGYRNAMLAQHLTDHAQLEFGPQDRRPAEVSRQIWDQLQRRENSHELALNLPQPRLPSGVERTPVPKDVFPANTSNSWRAANGSSALPEIRPQGTAPSEAPLPSPGIAFVKESTPAPALPAPAATATTSSAVAPATPAPTERGPALPAPAATPPVELQDVAQTPAANPVTLANNIDTEPAPDAALPAGNPSGVVTAMAETPPDGQGPRRRRADTTDATGLTVPAMASLPKVERAAPVDGPALAGPSLGGPKRARVEAAEPPPYLEVVGARKLPTEAVEAPAKKKQGILWGLGGMIAALLAAAYAFRTRWSAGGAKSQS